MSGPDAGHPGAGDAAPREGMWERPRVFISHSSTDSWVAQQLAAGIQRCGADTFLDDSDIHHGDAFEDRILDAEKQCSELVVLLTPWAMARPWVWIEISFFKHSRKRIVGILHGVSLDAIAQHPYAAILLKTLDMVDINHVDSYFEQLTRRVRAGEERGTDV